jgi:hypothetical protein
LTIVERCNVDFANRRKKDKRIANKTKKGECWLKKTPVTVHPTPNFLLPLRQKTKN